MTRWPIPAMSPWRWGIVLLVVVALPLRVHGLDRSLWLDEAWVANSLLEPDLAGLFYYEHWLQTTPPGFLLLERLVIHLLPLADWSFRLLPSLCGVLGVAALAWLALRLLRPPTACLVLLLFVFAPVHVVFSQMLKPYTADLLVAIVLMAAALAYLRERSTPVLLASVGAFVVLAGFSYNAVLFMPAFLYGALFDRPVPPRRLPVWRPRWSHVAAVALAVAVTALVNYAVFIEPNLDRNIAGRGIEPGLDAWLARLLVKAANLIRLFKHFFYSSDELWSGVWLQVLIIGAAFVALLGLCHLCARGGKYLERAAVLALPIAGASTLDVAGWYPLAAARLNMFLLPAVLILFGSGLQTLVLRARLLLRRRRARWLLAGSRPHAALGAALLVILALRFALAGPAPFVAWAEEIDEDSEAAIAWLAAVAGPGDAVYVHASMLEPLRLYARLTPIDGARLIDGAIGWPCCPRDVTLDRHASPARALPPELERIFDDGVRGTLWLLATGRRQHWEFTGLDYPDLLDRSLRERGCRRVESPHFEGVRLDGYRCPAADQRDASVRAPQDPAATGAPQ